MLFSYETRLGAAALMPRGVRACLGRRMAILRPRAGVDPQFLLYAFLGSEFQETIRRNAVHGATVERIPLNELPAWPIRLPGLAVQRAAARVLGVLDEKASLNIQIAETALQLMDATFASIIGSSATGSTTTFAELSHQGVLEFGDGYRTKRPELGKPGLPILRVAEVQDGRVTPSLIDHVSDSRRGAMGNKVSRVGDVVLTTKGTVGRVSIIPADAPEFVYSPQLCFFRLADPSPFSRYFMFAWFRGEEFRRQARGMKSQTDMADYLSLSDIKSLTITVPDREVERSLSRKLAVLHERVESAYREARSLKALRNVLLPELTSGELRVEEVEGESIIDGAEISVA
ncbi:hypothetical protein Van01_45990 [Micromonospora andamanensis]|uniref:Type I restriction modification DNA specificity domain-containing protein n=1 Tax=Micromonospora andamanensis TaxID=1287068 RepID=A0ABQ4I0G9_9ACTN|nr:hypothetical protein Van01_45990 [Micromonospora andamanensis]